MQIKYKAIQVKHKWIHIKYKGIQTKECKGTQINRTAYTLYYTTEHKLNNTREYKSTTSEHTLYTGE